MSATHTSWSAIPIEPMNPLLGRQFVSGSELTISRITLTKGAHVPTHQHPNEQAASILTGCLKFVLYELGPESNAIPREVILNPGEVLIIPPNVPHEAFALEDTVNLDIFAPPRQDWISGDDAYLRAAPPGPGR
jgi:quercetin dioxygenase-like cupin family protein